MPKQIFLDGLEIKGFRAFKHLILPKLSRVNLIVGKNSLGKTSLLEAIQLFVAEASITNIAELLIDRNEISLEKNGEVDLNRIPENNLAYDALFFGRPELDVELPSFSIASPGPDSSILQISYCRTIQKIEEEGGQVTRRRLIIGKEDAEAEGATPTLQINFSDRERLIPLDFIDRPRRLPNREADKLILYQYVPASGLSANEIALIWDKVALTDEEGIVYDALKLISSDIERLVFVANSRERYGRYAMVKIKGYRKPVPLLSLGEGINHLFGIAVSLVAARNGLLLIDEIENGLHYSVMPQLWKLILDQSRKLNVQVFAATHSLDCIRGFEAAATEMESSDALLIRLQGHSGNIEGVTFDPTELRIVTEEDIEVR